MTKIAYLVSHPIQYQAPLLKYLNQDEEIQLKAFFLSDKSITGYMDPGFGQKIEWDVPLLEGYDHEFLPSLGGRQRVSFVRPWSVGLESRLKKGEFDFLWVHGYAHKVCIQAIHLAKKLGIKVLMRGDSNLFSHPRGKLKLWAKNHLLPKLFRRCDGFLSAGSLNRNYYLHYGAREEEIFHMPYAVDNAYFQSIIEKNRADRQAFRKSLDLEEGRPVILYASKMTAQKNAMDLLEAYIRLANGKKQEPYPYLLFVGNGEERARLEAKAQRTGWNSIRFLGFQPQAKLPLFFDLCDVFVLTSSYESWGLVVNEAMNAGKSVIVGDGVGCAPDLVRPEENGFVVPNRDIDALESALEEIVFDPEKSKKMGQESLKIINAWNFSENLRGLKQAIRKLSR